MKKLRTEFEEIMQEIHPNGNLHVVWKRNLLCLPEFSSKKESCKPFQLSSKPHKSKPPELLTKQENHSIPGNFNKRSSKTSNSLNQCLNNQTPVNTTELYNIQGTNSERDKEVHRGEELVEKDQNHFIEDSFESEQLKKERKISLHTDSSETEFDRKTSNHCDHLFRNGNSLPRNSRKEQFMKNGNGSISTASFCLPVSSTSFDCSSFTDVTSVWDSTPSSPDITLDDIQSSESASSLLQERQNLAMELVWIQQAISSRKNYLQLKSQIET
ncbi:uncharacterized protein LOC106875371 isoform X2 [Octopus bimaculoides]|nr:uncharacterized protein LOC106875371 isoform X2 [Octopus bimaculoides]XP_052823464.1 uncharacterized protein LOC106875371 isoform X2 [Octopus bimaculoides]|eukprot:XP_014778955.1 PREDICTED: uncharacterized protein LOC106875371 isoform X2 [Octopus bimaculoides]